MTNMKVEIISGTVNGLSVGETIEVSKSDFESLEDRGFVKAVAEEKPKTASRRKAPVKDEDK